MKWRNIIPVIVAVGSGVVTLGLFFVRELNVAGFNLGEGLPLILDWVTTLTAIALLVGIANLLAVHVRKVSAFSTGWAYSSLLVIAFIATLFMWGLGALTRVLVEQNVIPASDATTDAINLGLGTVDFMFTYVQTPVEASLAALLAVILILAGARLIRRQRHWTAGLFIGVALLLIVILAVSFLPFPVNMHEIAMQWGVVGAVRGVLFGVALGVIATGLRVIAGVDHPYGE